MQEYTARKNWRNILYFELSTNKLSEPLLNIQIPSRREHVIIDYNSILHLYLIKRNCSSTMLKYTPYSHISISNIGLAIIPIPLKAIIKEENYKFYNFNIFFSISANKFYRISYNQPFLLKQQCNQRQRRNL